MEPILREIPGNYCRNGNFESGDLKFWQSITGLLSYNFSSSGFPGGGNNINIISSGVTVTFFHADFIPIREGEEVTLGFYCGAGTVAQYDTTLELYDSSFQLQATKSIGLRTLTPKDEYFRDVYRVPKGYSYIKAKYTFGGAPGFTAALTGFNINIQDSSIALGAIIQSKIVNLNQTAPVTTLAAQNSVFDPVDDNKLWKIVNLALWVDRPAGSTAGTHTFTITLNGFDRLAIFTANYNNSLGSYRKYNNPALVSLDPPDNTSLGNVLDNLYATAANPITVQYYNGTNVTQNNQRMITAQVIETYMDKIN